jgi:aspartate aminotransferase
VPGLRPGELPALRAGQMPDLRSGQLEGAMNDRLTEPSLVRSEAAAVVRSEGAALKADLPHASRFSSGLIGSPILKIAAEVRLLTSQGATICNLTVGDFAPSEFPVPDLLKRELVAAVEKGETNYPPSTGMPALRKAVATFTERRLGMRVDPDTVLIASGARPVIYGAYRTLVDPGERVVFPVPSWNNAHYCQMSGATAVPVSCDASSGFLPTARSLAGKLADARMLVINSPVNPTGTVIGEGQLAEICDAVLEENERRAGQDRPLYLLYDQVYWMLTFGVAHVHPVGLRPEIARYTIYVDGISKAFAATGLRVGWALGPSNVIGPMSDHLTHVGAWAPRPEQVATAQLLTNDTEIDRYHENMRAEVLKRLRALHDSLMGLKGEGFPVAAEIPSGAIYLSARFQLHGKRTPDGTTLRTDDDVRSFLLRQAGLAAVPFSSFGLPEGGGWFRLSVGAVSLREIEALVPRLRAALETLSG